jgi:hypothetical protein
MSPRITENICLMIFHVIHSQIDQDMQKGQAIYSDGKKSVQLILAISIDLLHLQDPIARNILFNNFCSGICISYPLPNLPSQANHLFDRNSGISS